MPTQNNQDAEFDPAISLNELYRQAEENKGTYETNGARANRHKIFTFDLSGPEVYELTEILRKVAVESRNYSDIAVAVKYERLLFGQARNQGF